MKKQRVITSVQFYHVHDVVEDMLRYDTAFASPKFPNIVAYPCFKQGMNKWGGKPTIDRWRSFLAGFDPNPFFNRELNIMTMRDDEWYTIDDGDKIFLREYLQR